ncbi:sugar phosphate nucleotidyltransferase [Pelagibacteraceae bacterium]|nr:sugar phosphate nucleotidyltransferase [Pelagibacteraceae bacterium]
MKNKKINNVLIMAAGRGMRMMPLTKKIPKAMAPIKGSTLIAKGIKKVHKFFNNVHVTVGYKGELLAKHVIELNVNSIFNTNKKGNSWWIFNTLLKNLDEPLFVLTCDNLYNIDFFVQLNEYKKIGKPACMIVPVKSHHDLDGDYILYNKNNINKISRKKSSDLQCSGVQIINPLKINELANKEDNFYKVWNKLIKIEQVKLSKFCLSNWRAIDNLEQLNKIK